MGKNNGAAQRRAKARQQARKSAAKSSSSDIAEKEPTSPPSAPGEEESVTDPPSTIEDTVIDAAPVALEEAASTEASHSNPPSIEATHEQDLQALRDQIQGLQTELEDTQRTLSESHQAFAEQIVELSSSHDHDKEAACAELRTQRDKAQEALTAAQERVASLEEQVQDLNQKITEHAAETSKHASAMADMQGKLAEWMAKAHTPSTETIATIVKELGYTDTDADYLHAAHNAKYTTLCTASRHMYEDITSTLASALPQGEAAAVHAEEMIPTLRALQARVVESLGAVGI